MQTLMSFVGFVVDLSYAYAGFLSALALLAFTISWLLRGKTAAWTLVAMWGIGAAFMIYRNIDTQGPDVLIALAALPASFLYILVGGALGYMACRFYPVDTPVIEPDQKY